MEEFAKFVLSLVLSGITFAIGNLGFDQGWGIVPFLVIWAIWLVVVFGGFLFLDDLDGVF